jgi:MinD-like ATPase involved in chromosome partitioning or flagellar assembly
MAGAARLSQGIEGCGNTLAEDRQDQIAGAEQTEQGVPAQRRNLTVPAARTDGAGVAPGGELAAEHAASDQAAAYQAGPVPGAFAEPGSPRQVDEQDATGDGASGSAPDEQWRSDGIGGLFGSRAEELPGRGTLDGDGIADTAPDGIPAAARARQRRRRRARESSEQGGRRAHARNGGASRDAGQAQGQVTASLPGGFSPSLLVPPRRRAPAPGWRRTVYRASGGLVRVPASAAETRRRDMISRARTPVAAGHYRIAVLSLKGGVGKTTITMGLGSMLAAMRGDRIIAVDASPDRGTLSDKLVPQTPATIRDLLDEREQILRYADVRAFTSQAPSRLEVLASSRDPAATVAFGEQDYREACAVLERYYSICITDCGTGLLHSAMAGVLGLADQIVLVSTASVDGARSASACMDWLAAQGHHDLVRNGVVAVTASRRHSRTGLDLGLLAGHFAARCRAVTVVPYDPYLAQGAEVELDQLRKTTASAFLELAAVVGDGFTRRHGDLRAITATANPGQI